MALIDLAATPVGVGVTSDGLPFAVVPIESRGNPTRVEYTTCTDTSSSFNLPEGRCETLQREPVVRPEQVQRIQNDHQLLPLTFKSDLIVDCCLLGV